MNNKTPQNSLTRPNWYKIRLPPHLTTLVSDCLAEEVDLKKFQSFRKISISCKNNGKTIFVRILFEDKLYRLAKQYGPESELVGLPVSYLIDVNKGILKGNDMKYDIGDNVMYHDVFPVYNKTIEFSEKSKFTLVKHRIFKFVGKFKIPLVNTYRP